MKKIYKYLIGLIVLILFIQKIDAISSGANEPIADNELGLTAKDCALQYCQEKDGMALWLSLVNECVDSPNPYFMEITKDNKLNNYEQNYNGVQLTNIVSGSICAMMGVIGLIFGYVIGNFQKNNEYTQVSQNESEVEM